MSKIHEATFPLLAEPNTHHGGSKLQEIKGSEDLPWSRACLPVALPYVIRAC